MKLRFIGQPFAGHSNLVDFIESATNQQFTDLQIAVAWAKRSGLGRVWDTVADFRSQGGRVRLIIGVSEGGATKEGLELALAGADESYVFHDPRRTFHPKVYFGSSDAERSLFVGSSNLTAGGLGWNYEASLWLDWDKGENDDFEETVTKWFERLCTETGSCLPLTAELIDKIENSGDIALGMEARARRVQKGHSDTPEDNDSPVASTINGLFSPILVGMRNLPGVSRQLIPTTPFSSIPEVAGQQPAAAPKMSGDQTPTLPNVTRRWFKQMDNTAAQQVKSAASNPTGNLRLSQEGAAINHRVYFRDDLFGGLPWTPTDGKASEQEVLVRFDVWIDGRNEGEQDLRLSHDPRRIAGQGNVPTVLHWGPLSPILRATNYIGFYVTLERLRGGRFNLIVSRAPRGEYLV